MLQAALNPAGGLRYHLRARRHRLQLWSGFRADLEAFFDSWRPAARKLALVGPSGGYCLPSSILARFEHVICFEPDPIARWVLSRRLHQLPGDRSVTWVTRDAWLEPLLRGRPPPLGAGSDDIALFFSNFIGQIMFLVDEPRWPELRKHWQAQVWPLLEHLPWASFHDRLSGPIAPKLNPSDRYAKRFDDARLLKLYAQHEAGELLDHGSADLLPPGERYAYLHWPLIPEQHHLIEAVIGRS